MKGIQFLCSAVFLLCFSVAVWSAELCEEKPANRATGIGNTELYNVCIPPLPAMPAAQADQVCEKLVGDLFRKIGEQDALLNCVHLHKVKCLQKDCPRPCNNSVTETYKGKAFYDQLGFYCQNNPQALQLGLTAACRMGPAEYGCDCFCPKDEQKQQKPEVEP